MKNVAVFGAGRIGRIHASNLAALPGVHVPPEARSVGLMFQDFALFPHLTVLENVAFGLRALPREAFELIVGILFLTSLTEPANSLQCSDDSNLGGTAGTHQRCRCEKTSETIIEAERRRKGTETPIVGEDSEESSFPEALMGEQLLLQFASHELLDRLDDFAGDLACVLARWARPSVLVGASLGGLAALYAHHRHPDTFGGVMAMSPSLWVSGERIFEHVSATSKPWTSRIYMDAGAQEAGGAMLRAAERMAVLLRQRGYTDATLRFRKDPRGKHSERDWQSPLPRPSVHSAWASDRRTRASSTAS